MDRLSVLYDHQAFENQRFGGISRYFLELISHLQIENELSLRYYTNDYLHENNLNCGAHYLPERIFKMFLKQVRRKNRKYSIKRLKNSPSPIFHATYFNPYFINRLKDKAYVITVHDMNYELLPQYLPGAEPVIAIKKETILRADRIIAISENTKKDIVSILNVDPNKIDVVYHGVSTITGDYHKLRLPERYVLYVGDRRAYKNFDMMLKAFAVIAQRDKDLQLVCTGRPFTKEETISITQYGLLNRVINHHVDEKGLKQLYQQAQVFVFPSLYEGFGLPILEAFSYDCPTLVSNTSCFPEIAGDAASYFDPYSLDSLVEQLRTLLQDQSLREQLVKAGKERVKPFTWETCARNTENVYRKLL